MTFKEHILLRLWNKHKKFFLSQYIKEVAKPILKTDLRYIFTDLQGKKYYEFSQDKPLPVERYGKQSWLLEYFRKGFSPEEEADVLSEMEICHSKGLKDPKGSARIGYLITLLRERNKIEIHTELLYSILACQWVREDEQFEIVNEKIHQEKIIAFKEYVHEHGSYFFFQSAALKKLNHLQNMSESGWSTLFHESLITIKATEIQLKNWQAERLKKQKENETSEIT